MMVEDDGVKFWLKKKNLGWEEEVEVVVLDVEDWRRK